MEDNKIVVTPNFRLYLNESELSDDLMSAIEGISFEDEINLPAMFSIRFNIVNFLNGRWRGIDLETFNPGDSVKVFMGLDKAEEMMTGEITALEPTFGDPSFMEIRGFDRLHRLMFGKKRRTFSDMKSSDIASSIASEAGLTPNVDDTSTLYPSIFQNNQSNYEFILEHAKRIGYEIAVYDKEFIFRRSQEDKEPEVTLEYGIDLERFSVKLKSLTEGSEVEVRGWDTKKKEEITSTASRGSETTKMAGKETGHELSKDFGESSVSLIDNLIIDTADAEDIAKARYNIMLKEFLTGEGICSGNSKIRAGKTIEIKGIGERFSGIYYIASTTHTINQDGYKTKFKVRRTGA